MRLRLLILAATMGAWLAVGAGPAAPAEADWNGQCAATSVTFTTSGPGTVNLGPSTPLAGRKMHVNGPPYLAKNVTVTLRMQNTTFVISPGTAFRPECFGAYGKGPYPSVKLYLGKVRVKSQAKAARRLMVQGSTIGSEAGSPQQTGVRTWEAVAHTLSPHNFEYTVERKAKTPADGNAGRGLVTVETVKGGPIMLSPRVGLKKEWACKTGEAFTVDWQGNVSQG